MSVLAQAATLFYGSSNKHPELRERWLAANRGLRKVGLEPFRHNLHDDLMDALLRSMEDETASYGTEGPHSEVVGLGMSLQFMLSRQWLLTNYELLRMAKGTPFGQASAALRALYEDFRLVRVPMAKHEIAEDHRLKDVDLELLKMGDEDDVIVYNRKNKVPYLPITVVNTDTGSIGWRAVDLRQGIVEREVFRRDLSDRFLDVLAAI